MTDSAEAIPRPADGRSAGQGPETRPRGARPIARTARRRLSRRRRMTRISRVLTCHGLGYLLGRFGLEGLLPLHKGLLGHAVQTEPYNRPEHLRLALEELGATAIKLGQVLSTRADLLSPTHVEELARLRDRVPPVPVAAIRGVIEQEFGRPVAELFAAFDDAPLAAASIGQVHAARLFSGEEVVVKVQKPGVAEQIEVDLRLLLDLARMAQRRSPLARDYDLVAIVEELARTLRAELDYQWEGQNADTFRIQFADDPAVVVPTIHWSHTTERVLTMQRLSGVKIDDLDGLRARHVDPRTLAERSANLVLAQVFEHGFFHADPHPGNLLVLEGATVALLDFGMVGRLTNRVRLDLLELMAAVVDRDAERTVDAFEALGVADIEAARPALVRDVGHLLDRYVGRSIAELRLDAVTEALFAVVRRHRLRMPADLVLLLKTLAMHDGVGRHLAPEFNLFEVATPFLRAAMRRRLHPSAWEPELRRGAVDLARVGLELPGNLRRLSRRLDRGELTMTVRHQGLDEPLQRLEAMVNRLALSALVSAFVVGTGLIMVVYHPGGDASWLGWFFWSGLALAVLLGLRLVLAVRRGGRG